MSWSDFFYLAGILVFALPSVVTTAGMFTSRLDVLDAKLRMWLGAVLLLAAALILIAIALTKQGL